MRPKLANKLINSPRNSGRQLRHSSYFIQISWISDSTHRTSLHYYRVQVFQCSYVTTQRQNKFAIKVAIHVNNQQWISHEDINSNTFEKVHFLIVACVFQMEMFRVQYLWKQKTWSALGIYHEDFHEFLRFVTRGFIIISSVPKWYASAEKLKQFRNTQICHYE